MTKTPLGLGDRLLGALLFLLIGFYGIWLFGPLLTPPRTSESYSLRVTATSHLKQILMASIIYSEDHEGRLPPQGHWEVSKPPAGPWIKGDQMAWREALQPYIKNYENFRHRAWPFKAKEGSRLELVRGVTNGASCYGYVEEITPKWFGDSRGVLTLSPGALSPEFLKEAGGSRSEGPLIEDLAWNGKGWFGRDEQKRITDSFARGYRILGMTDTAVRVSRLERSES